MRSSLTSSRSSSGKKARSPENARQTMAAASGLTHTGTPTVVGTTPVHHPRRHAAVRTSNYIFSQLIPYIGNKRKLLPLIHEGIRATGIDRGSFVDLFSGSTVVSRFAKTLGYRRLGAVRLRNRNGHGPVQSRAAVYGPGRSGGCLPPIESPARARRVHHAAPLSGR